ncbi:MAG: DUF362 domain-containing protein [Armatimonadetes bacterium]|nr:DUF362 domain-containing protein [Armatimonadota bacterium]
MGAEPHSKHTTDPVAALRGKVAVLKTCPETVVADVGRLMDMAGFPQALPREHDTILKINISWHHYYPACSTTPWQLEGVTQRLLEDGRPPETLIPAQNRTVVVDPKVGAVRNRLDVVMERYGLEFVYLYEPGSEWITYHPHCELTALPEFFPDGVQIPKLMIGRNALHLPTMKTHVFTTTTGAMKNAFGGLLNDNRHWTHARIHETLVDLLAIQQEIHPGLFAVMDGTIAGNGPGPRAMIPVVKNYLLASADQVAIDATAAKMMGFDPMKLDYIRLAHERGLGVGNPSEVEVLGEDISEVNFGFTVGDTFASRGQKTIYHGWMKPLERLLLRTPIVPWSFLASRLYHDAYWFPCVGRHRVAEIMQTEWGALFDTYSRGA